MSLHVLVVDDEPVLRRTLDRALKMLGYTVTTVADAEAAYHLVGEQHFDAILVDVHMPQVAGDTLCLALLRRAPGLKGRLILMTGDPWTVQQGWPAELQACPLLAKPFGLEVLGRTIADTLAALRDEPRDEPRRINGHG